MFVRKMSLPVHIQNEHNQLDHAANPNFDNEEEKEMTNMISYEHQKKFIVEMKSIQAEMYARI